MKKTLLFILLFTGTHAFGQNAFNAIYPIGDNPGIGYRSNMASSGESILFEANPILRMPIWNNILVRLQSKKRGESGQSIHYRSASTMYLAFRPRLRMYHDISKPVKTPSYQISILGYQHIFRLHEPTDKRNQLLSFSIESGHYSNGQSKCAFDPNADDGSEACKMAFASIDGSTDLSQILNRESGNFSTNYSEIKVNYRLILDLNDNYEPTSGLSITLGWLPYHNDLLLIFPDIGGYSPEDIEIYGRHRFLSRADYFFRLDETSWLHEKIGLDRFSFGLDYEYIHKPHRSVDPHRLEASLSSYFKNNVGIEIAAIWGHDNYNYRFVDRGFQFSAGLTFDIFPPVEIR